MNTTVEWQITPARIVRGHRVASGLNGNPVFPGGTLLMQTPVFRELGFDLSAYHLGTLNITLAPRHYRVIRAPMTLRQVRWHPTEPPEDFSFFDAKILPPGGHWVEGKVYYPHPETKPAHFHQNDVLELIMPFISGLEYGMEIQVGVRQDQMIWV